MTRYVLAYLIAIIAANLIVAHFGPAASIPTALLFIGLDLTARDALHDAWRHDLTANMGLLIATGSLLTIILNRATIQISIASFVAFTGAAIIDTIAYHKLSARPRLARVNGSNLFSSAADSIIFPLLAFGWPPLLPIMAGQFAAKLTGGFLWSLMLK